MDVNEELLEVLSRGLPFCPHLHIPLQSGDDQILAAMKRHYTAGDFKRLVGEIKDRIRDVAVTTDIIVGFPGETEDNFMNTYRLAEEMGFAGLHVFRYSPRKGTAAASMAGQVTGEAKDRRSRRLIELGSALAGEFASRYSGREVEVLVEDLAEGRPGLLQGHTPNYLLVVFPGDEALKGQIVRVRAGNVSGGVLEGRKL
jgi:threonylcarbamoyladenosine tRNA methylthiotransferase MtaB